MATLMVRRIIATAFWLHYKFVVRIDSILSCYSNVINLSHLSINIIIHSWPLLSMSRFETRRMQTAVVRLRHDQLELVARGFPFPAARYDISMPRRILVVAVVSISNSHQPVLPWEMHPGSFAARNGEPSRV